MTFTVAIEQNKKMSFLDVYITRKQGKFITCVYRKPTFSDVYTTYFDSFLPDTY